jgi:hypothetical protein
MKYFQRAGKYKNGIVKVKNLPEITAYFFSGFS